MSVLESDSPGPPVEPATGFWRVGRPLGAQPAWLFAPDGQATFVLGVNTVMHDARVDGAPRCAGIVGYIHRPRADGGGAC
jgi:hypothetical protein